MVTRALLLAFLAGVPFLTQDAGERHQKAISISDPSNSDVSPASVAALPTALTKDRGAVLSFVEYEAEKGRYRGALEGPDRTFTRLAAEASGRMAVRLAAPGDFVEFKLASPANAVTVRAALPDTPDGNGLSAELDVMVDGKPGGRLRLTSHYAWLYGKNPFTNRPADGTPHHYFDEARMMFGRVLRAGTVVRFAMGKRTATPWSLIDLADFEVVPEPYSPPAGALSVLDFAADASGIGDSLPAFRAAVAAGSRQGRTVWVPPGEFRLNGHLEVDRVTLAGAGPWYSVLRGTGVGIYGRYAPNPSQAVTIRDLAIIGEVTERDDRVPLSGIGGSMGGGSRLINLWIQHQKTGVWLDGPIDGLRISGLRILDTTADGLNFRRGVSHAVVENSFVRNSGDDGLAMWSRHDANHDNVFRRNTVVAPGLANGIAIYGGRDIQVIDNLVSDTLAEGGGLHVGNRFNATPLSGTIQFVRNTVVRGGSFDRNWRQGIGAIWLYALEAPIGARILFKDTLLVDSSEQAVLLKGKAVTDVSFDGLTVRGARGGLLQMQAPGVATFRGVVAAGADAAIVGCRPDFRLLDAGGNQGWHLSNAPRDCRLAPIHADVASSTGARQPTASSSGHR